MRKVGDPGLEAIKDVGCIHNGRASLLTLLLEKVQQVQTAHHIHVHCNLIQQQHLSNMQTTGCELQQVEMRNLTPDGCMCFS